MSCRRVVPDVSATSVRRRRRRFAVPVRDCLPGPGRRGMTDEVPERRGKPRGADVSRVGRLSVRSEGAGVLHTIALEGELEIAGAAELERELLRVERTDALSIVVDLWDLAFIGSTGVRLLLQADANHGQTPTA